jgi:hypothetical protein
MLAFSPRVLEPAKDSIGGFVGAVEAAEVLCEHGRRRGRLKYRSSDVEAAARGLPEAVRASTPVVWLVFTGSLPDKGSWWFR